MNTNHQCTPDEVVSGVMVAIELEMFHTVCPQHDEETLRILLQRHSQVIAIHMMSAGIQAAIQLFKSEGGTS